MASAVSGREGGENPMKELKLHLKLKGRTLCGAKTKTRKLRFVTDKSQVTCENCQRATEK